MADEIEELPWRVDLAFAVRSMEEWQHGTTLCVAAAGDAACDSGTGFGERDMQFYYPKADAAIAAFDALKALDLPFVYLHVDVQSTPDREWRTLSALREHRGRTLDE